VAHDFFNQLVKVDFFSSFHDAPPTKLTLKSPEYLLRRLPALSFLRLAGPQVIPSTFLFPSSLS
ncbi:TPA: hypothetical protein ACJIOU_005064, partial [Escherichia coli]